jgi:hypothetical protein
MSDHRANERYVSERHTIALMSRELRGLQSLERRGLASLVLTVAGFSKPDVSEYLDRAIESERLRRSVMGAGQQLKMRA